jgi:dTDP-glucose pyrophosphorylase
MKALILAGGRGNRLDELSALQNKCMIKVNEKPVVQYSFDYISATDIEEIIVVVGHRAEEIINYFGIEYKGKRLKYVIQKEQRGLVHAMECARDAIDGDDFMLLLGDEILIDPKHKFMINEFKKEDVFGLCGVLFVEDRDYIKRTYTLIHDDSNRVYRVIEKPRRPLSNIMGTGNCVFKNDILNYINFTPIHHERQEKELPDLMQCAIDDGKTIRIFPICTQYTNINEQEDIAMAIKFL